MPLVQAGTAGGETGVPREILIVVRANLEFALVLGAMASIARTIILKRKYGG